MVGTSGSLVRSRKQPDMRVACPYLGLSRAAIGARLTLMTSSDLSCDPRAPSCRVTASFSLPCDRIHVLRF